MRASTVIALNNSANITIMSFFSIYKASFVIQVFFVWTSLLSMFKSEAYFALHWLGKFFLNGDPLNPNFHVLWNGLLAKCHFLQF